MFTDQPVCNFYDQLFLHLDLSMVDNFPKTGRKGFSNSSMLCAFIVMKCEGFSMVSDLVDYLHNNKKIAHFCGFNLAAALPSYWTFIRFIKKFDHDILTSIMNNQVLSLAKAGIIDSSFLSMDATPISANTSHNNSKSFKKNKFKKSNQPAADKDCRLGVHTASNSLNEKNFEFYWGYKNHMLVDCITGLPVCELTTTANISDSSVALYMLDKTNSLIPIKGLTFIADKGYDIKNIYNSIVELYDGDCFIPLNQRNSKQTVLVDGYHICQAGLPMHKDGKCYDRNRVKQKYSCPFKYSKNDACCPCNHKNFFNGKKNRGCTKWVTLPSDYRLQIDRKSKRFKKTYSLRTESERYNSRFKNTGQERAWVRNFSSIANLSTMAHIALLAVAVACIATGKRDSYRKLKTLKRSA